MTAHLTLSARAARQFLLTRHGLSGPHRFEGSEGILNFIQMVGSIQFDPIDICGRNSDLVLQSRVKGYRKHLLWDLLYRQRQLVDYYDKELCIFPIQDWPAFARMRAERRANDGLHEEIAAARGAILQSIALRGASSARDLDQGKSVDWHWGTTRLARATMEHLYYLGELGIASKKGITKHYDLIERLIPEELLRAPDPFANEDAFHQFLLLRRIGAVGMLWNRASPAWLASGIYKAAPRNAAFAAALDENALLPVQVEGIRDTFYVRAQEEQALIAAMDAATHPEDGPPRCELIAPLDNLLWDRALVKAVFGFSYVWEVYTPPAKRVYGHYVLPVLFADRLIARAEPVFDRKTRQLHIRNIWPEEGIDLKDNPYRDAIADCLARFARFHTESAETES